MQKLPTVVGLKVCHEAIVEEKTRNVTLVNCFRKLRFDQFPTRPTEFTACAVLTDGKGEYRLRLDLVSLDDLDVIATRSWMVSMKDAVKEYWFLLSMQECVFPHPGKYQLNLGIDKEHAAQTSFHVLGAED